MGIKTAQAAFLQALGCQEQVHVERAAKPAYRNKKFREVWVLAQKFGELIDHNDQRRKWAVFTHCVVRGVELTDVGKVTGLAQQLLAAVHLTRNGVIHALHQGGFLFQVGDDRRSMRQFITAEEGRASFKVHEDEVEFIRAMRGGKSYDECS